MLQTLLRPGQTERAEAGLAALDEHERGDPEIHATLASMRLAQHDPQTATATLAPVIDGSVGFQPLSVVAALPLEGWHATRSATRPPPGAPWSGRSISPGPTACSWLSSSTRRRSCSSAMPGSAPRAPSLIAGVLSLLAATSKLAAPPGESQRLREPSTRRRPASCGTCPLTHRARDRRPAVVASTSAERNGPNAAGRLARTASRTRA